MTEVEIATPMEEVNTNTEVTMDTVLAKIEEMNQLSKWLQKYGKQYIRKNTRNQKRRNLGENGKSKSGFAVPVTVSEQLALFLGMNLTDEIPRTEVTKRTIFKSKEIERISPLIRHFLRFSTFPRVQRPIGLRCRSFSAVF
jgi:NurA-like 5'-3' nuclease